jgi:hypothetical protein
VNTPPTLTCDVHVQLPASRRQHRPYPPPPALTCDVHVQVLASRRQRVGGAKVQQPALHGGGGVLRHVGQAIAVHQLVVQQLQVGAGVADQVLQASRWVGQLVRSCWEAGEKLVSSCRGRGRQRPAHWSNPQTASSARDPAPAGPPAPFPARR